jgi:class 3 adenylate cyclase
VPPPAAPIQMVPQAKRVVTALAVDLTGVGPLTDALEAGDAALVLDEAASRLVTAVEAMGGAVVECGEATLTALFGASEMHEDDPERALRAALRIVEQVAAYGAEVATAWDVPALQARVGVSTGPTKGRDGEAAIVGNAAAIRSVASPGAVSK